MSGIGERRVIRPVSPPRSHFGLDLLRDRIDCYVRWYGYVVNVLIKLTNTESRRQMVRIDTTCVFTVCLYFVVGRNLTPECDVGDTSQNCVDDATIFEFRGPADTAIPDPTFIWGESFEDNGEQLATLSDEQIFMTHSSLHITLRSP